MSAPRNSDNAYGGGRQYAAFTAACPSCEAEVDWYSDAQIVGDLSRTSVSYRIDCSACEDEPERTEPAVRQLRPVSQLGWLGRSA